MATIEQLKSEISDKYLDDFKEQLGFLKSLVLLPIKDDIKKILTGQAQLPQKFDEVKEFWWGKDIINFVTPNIANQIFAFMKEKRTEIETRKTEQELQQLKQEILSGIKVEIWEGKNSPENQTLASEGLIQESAPQDNLEKSSEKDPWHHSEIIGVWAGAAGLFSGICLNKNLKIIQRSDYFNFSIDSLLISEFVNIQKNTKKILDLGTGNAAIPLFLSKKTYAKIYGIEIQEISYNLALRNINIFVLVFYL